MQDGDIWKSIEAAGPLRHYETFDPLLVDDVLVAERSTAQYDRRRAFVASFAWAVPTPEAIDLVRRSLGERRILEVGAGSGLWAKLLTDAGLHVVATDPALSGTGTSHFPVEPFHAEAAVARYSECEALLLCWPPFKDACAFHALRVFEGDRVAYIGDVRFTAEGRFHALLASDWRLLEQTPLPSWPGTSDSVYIYGRRLTAADDD